MATKYPIKNRNSTQVTLVAESENEMANGKPLAVLTEHEGCWAWKTHCARLPDVGVPQQGTAPTREDAEREAKSAIYGWSAAAQETIEKVAHGYESTVKFFPRVDPFNL